MGWSCPTYRVRVVKIAPPRGMRVSPMVRAVAIASHALPPSQQVLPRDDARITGHVTAVVVGNGLRVVLADVRPGRCGIGRALYTALAKAACKRGLVLRSDVERTDAAEGFWKKQLAAGHARLVDDDFSSRKRYEVGCPAPRELAALRRNAKGRP